MAILFSTEDLKTAASLERILRQFETAVNSAENKKPEPIDLNKLAMQLAPLISQQLQAGGSSPLNLQSLLPTGALSASDLEDTHANRLALYTPPLTVGTTFFETDRTVTYIAILSSGSIVWRYKSGAYQDVFANRPADLGVDDAGFKFVATDTEQHYRWSSAAWVDEIQTAFTLLRFGGITVAFVALKRSGTILQVRLADDSAYSSLEVLDEVYDATAWNGSVQVPTKNAVRDKIETLLGSSPYTPTNVTPQRSFDAVTGTLSDALNVLGTLIGDLQTTKGILS